MYTVGTSGFLLYYSMYTVGTSGFLLYYSMYTVGTSGFLGYCITIWGISVRYKLYISIFCYFKTLTAIPIQRYHKLLEFLT